MTEYRKLIDSDPPPPETPRVPWGIVGFQKSVELGIGIGLGLILLGFIVGAVWAFFMGIGNNLPS